MQVDLGAVFSDGMEPPCRAGGRLLAPATPSLSAAAPGHLALLAV